MRGVCVDITNRPPSAKALLKLGVTGVRLEVRDDADFVWYTESLQSAGLELAYLIGPSSPSNVQEILDESPNPNILIIGNEPDVDGDSSWTMSPDEYIQFWNEYAARFRTELSTRVCTAGMLNKSTNYLKSVWDSLDPKPDMVDVHYPDYMYELQAFARAFYRPVAVFEWCYKTGTRQQVIDWENRLERYTSHSCWYAWSENMAPTMGLVSVKQNPTKAYYNYKAAL